MKNQKTITMLTIAMTVLTFAFLVFQFVPHYQYVQDLVVENEAGEWVEQMVPVKYSIAGFTWMESITFHKFGVELFGRDFDLNKDVTALVFAFLAAVVALVLDFAAPTSVFNVIVSAIFGGFGSIGYFTSRFIFLDKSLWTDLATGLNGWIDIACIAVAGLVLLLAIVKTVLLVPTFKGRLAKLNKKYR